MTGIKTKKELLSFQKKFGTDIAIAQQLCVTRQAIHQLRVKFGIGTTTNKIERNKMIRKEYRKGSANLLANRYRLSITQIYRIVR